MPDEFEKYSEHARKTIARAHEEAQRLGHRTVGTGNLLLALLRDWDSVPARILRNCDVLPHRIRAAIETATGWGLGDAISDRELSESADWALKLAADESRQLNCPYIETEHLFLGLLRERDGIAARILHRVGLDLERARIEVARIVMPHAPLSTQESPSKESSMSDQQFEKFTERSRTVFMLAQEESALLRHNYIGAEHLLLGLVREGDGIAGRVLANLGVTLPKAREAVAALVERGEGPLAATASLAPQAKKVIELAMGEARRMNNHYIGTEHLLLGLVMEREGTAVAALERMGIAPEQVQQVTVQAISVASSYQPAGVRDELSVPLPQGPMTGKFEKFSERARKVFSLAQEEAQRFNHNYIGTEHLLLGLVREGDGIAARVLANLGVQPPKFRSAIEFIIGRGDGLVIGDLGLTPRAKKVIELAMDEARRLNNHYIGTEHLLLGLVREGEGIGAGVLESLGVSLEKVRHHVMLTVSGGSSIRVSLAEQSDTEEHSSRLNNALRLLLELPDSEFSRLIDLADQQGCTLADLIHEAIRRTWLTDEQGSELPNQNEPPSDS